MIKRLIYFTFSLFVINANAALLYVDNGMLMGAGNVDVGGTLYDVEFVDGACADVFTGCDELSDLDFNDFNTANLAAQALIDQVFIDGIDGNFDSETTNIFGCGNESTCVAYVPYAIINYFQSPGVNTRFSANRAGNQIDNIGNNINNSISGSPFYGERDSDVYARFTVTYIPEPSTFAIFALGLMGLVSRRFKNTLKASK